MLPIARKLGGLLAMQQQQLSPEQLYLFISIAKWRRTQAFTYSEMRGKQNKNERYALVFDSLQKLPLDVLPRTGAQGFKQT